MTAGIPEEELSVEVGHINRIHIDDIDVAKTSQSEILE